MSSSFDLIMQKYGADGPDFVHRYTRLTFKKHIHLMALCMKSLPGLRVLDVGCGTGQLLVELAQTGAEAVGIDTFQEGEIDYKIANARAREAGVEVGLAQAGASALPFASEAFDIVTSFGMLEHIPPPARSEMLREMFRVVRSHGFLFLIAGPTRMTPFDQHVPKLPFANWLPHSWKAYVNPLFGNRQFLDIPWGISRRQIRHALPSDRAEINSLYSRFFALPAGQPLGPFRFSPIWLLAWAKRAFHLHRLFGYVASLIYFIGLEHCHILMIRKKG